MISIKKVAVTPLAETTGAVIDSFNTEDDKRTNAPSIKIVEEKLGTKQNKILHGTSEPSNNLGENGDIYLQHV